MRVLVTRAEKEGRATAARLEALGHTALLEPLTTIVAVEDPALPPVESLQAVTTTSLNAVEVLAGRPAIEPYRHLPFLAVGGRTAEAARAAGFDDVHSADGDRRDLVAAITSELDPAKGAILWLVGRDRAGDLVADLTPAGFTVVPVEVYRAEAVASLSETTRQALTAGEIDAALVFSPRSGAILLERLAECGFSPGSLGFPVHVISEAAARPFREAGWRDVVVAMSPDTDAMLATLRPAPPSADPVGDQTRSSPMRPKSRKDTRSAPAAEAEVAAEAPVTAVEPVEPAVDADRAEEAAFRARVEAAEKAEIKAEREPAPAAVVPPPPQPAPRRRGFGIGGVLVATLLGGALGVGGSYGLALQGLLPQAGGDGGRVAALEKAVAGLETRKPAADPATTERLAALEKRVTGLAGPATDTATLARLGALEQHLRQMATVPAPAAASAAAPATAAADPALPDRLAALEQKIAGLGATPATSAAPAAAVDLSGIEGRLARLEAAKPAAPDLSGFESRLGKLETTAKPAADLSGLEERLGRLEGVPQVRLPADLADRVAGLEAAAKARAESGAASVAGALSGIGAEGASRQALAEMAGQVDRALGSMRENAGAEIAALKARIERLGGGIDAESRALVDRAGADAKALAARLGIETQGVADRLAAQTAAAVEDLRKRNDELSRALTERMNALVAASDVEGRRRIEDLARAFAEKSAALGAALEAEAKKRGEETAEALKKLRGDLDAALGRVTTLETATREVGSSGQKMVEKVGEAAAAAETKVGALENRLAGIEAEAEAARRARGEAMVAIALSDLKVAAETGRPFTTELGVAEAASKGTLDLAALKRFADTGMPTAASLRAGWAKVTRAAIAAGESRDGGGGVLDRLLSNAGSMVKVRQRGDTAGEDVAALAGRVEAKLAAGDFAGALAAWKALPEASRKASAEWGDTLAARVAADTALADRIAAVTAKLAQPK